MAPSYRTAYLLAMGITPWVSRQTAGMAATSNTPADVEVSPATVPTPVPWTCLQQEVAECTGCPLHQTRTHTVFGVGDPQASLMVVGEAPGEQEDLQGEPFVGRAGLLLNEMLRALGLTREQVFIANVLKCRPPANRDPKPDESASCEPYLQRQIRLVQPAVLLAVGRVATQNLLKTTAPMAQLRGKVHLYENTPLIASYHPAYLLRSPLEKRKAWEDLQLCQRVLTEVGGH